MSSDPNGRSVCIARPHGELQPESREFASAQTLDGLFLARGTWVGSSMERRLNMKVLQAWRRTMLSILASMAFLPVAMSTFRATAQEFGAPPGIQRGEDGLGYYAAGYEPGPGPAPGAYGPGPAAPYGHDGYGPGYDYGDGYGDGYGAPGEAFFDNVDTECRFLGHRLRNALCLLAPYTAGGRCAPRWYDFSFEVYALDRDVSRDVTYLAHGFNAVGGPALSTQDLNFDYEGTLRFTFAAQVGPAGIVEFSYLGLGNWNSAAAVVDNNQPGDLFSPFSQFGLIPANGYDETDQGTFGSLAYSTTFDSYELNLRRRWQGPTCLFQGSYLAGVRHFRLEEAAVHNVVGRNGSLDYLIGTSNSLTGFQIGGDIYLCAIPGIMVGGEIKGGIYGNAADQVSTMTSTINGVSTTATETIGKDTAAFVGEAGVSVIYRLNQNITLKGGYHCLYVSSVALAAENANFAPASIAGVVGTRTPVINVGGDAFYHGAVGGVELSW
jgi:hypothetical protein